MRVKLRLIPLIQLREPDSNQAQNMVLFSLKRDQPRAAVSTRETDHLSKFVNKKTPKPLPDGKVARD
jgi:hypothetical protein